MLNNIMAFTHARYVYYPHQCVLITPLSHNWKALVVASSSASSICCSGLCKRVLDSVMDCEVSAQKFTSTICSSISLLSSTVVCSICGHSDFQFNNFQCMYKSCRHLSMLLTSSARQQPVAALSPSSAKQGYFRGWNGGVALTTGSPFSCSWTSFGSRNHLILLASSVRKRGCRSPSVLNSTLI